MTENDINIYNNGRIYTVRCRTDNNLIYVGSTTQPLHKRFHEHKRRLKNSKYNSSLFYSKIIELGFDDFYIELYENYPCNSKEELNKREGEVIREIGTLNSNIAGRTKEEYKKIYYEKNKERLKEYKKEYGKHYYESNKDNINTCNKEYRETNKEKIKQKKSDYYQKNKEKINDKKKNTFICGCGLSICYGHKARHEKTQKHINLMKEKEEQI